MFGESELYHPLVVPIVTIFVAVVVVAGEAAARRTRSSRRRSSVEVIIGSIGRVLVPAIAVTAIAATHLRRRRLGREHRNQTQPLDPTPTRGCVDHLR